MKQVINYFYNLNIESVDDYSSYYHFNIEQENYYFVKCNRSEKEINDIILASKELKEKNIPCHDIIVNKFKQVITLYNGKKYVLLRCRENPYTEIDLNDMVNINNKITLSPSKSNLFRNYWQKLWESKIDYLEYQVRELGHKKNVILNSFSYYVGLAENAISYVNNTQNNIKPNNLDKITVCHRRVGYPNLSLNYYNPLSYIFDLEVRDVAEYIKSVFFNGGDAIGELSYYLKVRPLGIYSYRMLYARLVFPTYYFDNFDQVMNNGKSEEILLPLINKIDEYELFLKTSYNMISNYALIEPIEWIIKKKL